MARMDAAPPSFSDDCTIADTISSGRVVCGPRRCRRGGGRGLSPWQEAITGGSPCSHAARTSGPEARGMFHVKHPYEKNGTPEPGERWTAPTREVFHVKHPERGRCADAGEAAGRAACTRGGRRLMAEGAWAQAGDQPVGGAARGATDAGGAGERDADARTGGTRAPGCFT